ncbi:Panacea domain-containing protein [Bradyrhizobium sp. CB82]|uniref:Panacea domain-containing protein n=1 Tax=Bradyrhizobium sp. CB82 TaxID=3039159 RepID=UPI0024B04AA5|nr:Panacea domain-containing protein [Bradyrhizobium sp. CB82]WFU40835.1 Panacea domain-containing protein [Bradyrhizobium sp. CB82]
MAGKYKKLSFTVSVERSAQRFRELIVYISKRSEADPHFGAVKLNKILYYSDFRAFERFGVPLTGMSYFRLKAGPAPKALVPIRRELEAEGAIKIEHVDLGNGYEQHRTVALREPVLEHFTADELQVVDEVIKELWNQNATEVSDASHDVRWRVLCNKDTMPYEFAFLSNESVTKSEIERTRELAEQFGW